MNAPRACKAELDHIAENGAAAGLDAGELAEHTGFEVGDVTVRGRRRTRSAAGETPATLAGRNTAKGLARAALRPPFRAALVVVALATTMAALFATSYTLALGRAKPHHIPLGLVGDGAGQPATAAALEHATRRGLTFRTYGSTSEAQAAIAGQQIYGALVLGPTRPRLLVASASGISVARVLEAAAGRVSVGGAPLTVQDVHPLPAGDPQGLVPFYAVLVAGILGFLTTFQLVAHARGLTLRAWLGVIAGLTLFGGLVLALVVDPLIGALHGPLLELWAALGAEILAAALFTSAMILLVGRWAILPTFAVFVILGNASSGGAVAPPLLPPPYEFIGRFLPPGATVELVRNAVYFRDAQHLEPALVMAAWIGSALTAVLLFARLRGRSPAGL